MNPVLAWTANIIKTVKKGSMGITSKNSSRYGDCKNVFGSSDRMNASSLKMKVLEKIGLTKGSRKRMSEIAEPTIRVFHG